MILILKLFFKEEKLLFFITNLRAFCIHFLQILPLESAGNTLRFRGKNSIFFRRSFFSRYALGMPSFNNSVCQSILFFSISWSVSNKSRFDCTSIIHNSTQNGHYQHCAASTCTTNWSIIFLKYEHKSLAQFWMWPSLLLLISIHLHKEVRLQEKWIRVWRKCSLWQCLYSK